ncbi:MAG: 30S ribosomal protein S3 [Parcubacteria group bacterium GW2011_GWA2_47_12]|nr:MAG: 30S ribosomal protein S3 [Parcubacteria group bacterium GW2011_GWA2_47_12]
MSHTVHPYAHRIGIIRDWKSRWFGVKDAYRDTLRRDIIIREFLAKRLRGMYVSDIIIERGAKKFRVVVKTARPGLLVGRGGEGAVKMKDDLNDHLRRKKALSKEEMRLDIEEVRSPEGSAAIVAQMIAEGLEKRLPFRRVMKQTIEKVMANRDVKGIRVVLSGMLGGGSMSRLEAMLKGRVPLQTLRADIDFARERANLPLGVIGIKVWIYKGEIFSEKQRMK